jgi:hypothetical protein
MQLMGVIFKVNHWSGAGIILMLSILLMVLLFFPIALTTSYKQHKDKSQLHLYIIAYITIAIESLGMLFKIMHWPGASVLIFIGLPLPFLLFLPFYLRYHNKAKVKSDKNFFGVIFFMIYMAVISSFLALDASMEVYESFIPQIEKSVAESSLFDEKNNQSYKLLIQNQENEADISNLQLLNTSADNLCKILGDAKREIIISASKINKQLIANETYNYYSLKDLYKKGNTVSFVNQKGDDSKENLIETKLIEFENAIKILSEKNKLNDIVNYEDSYALALIRNNMYEDRFLEKSMIENLAALSFMQNRVRFIEYQILSKLQN